MGHIFRPILSFIENESCQNNGKKNGHSDCYIFADLYKTKHYTSSKHLKGCLGPRVSDVMFLDHGLLAPVSDIKFFIDPFPDHPSVTNQKFLDIVIFLSISVVCTIYPEQMKKN